MVFAGVFIGLFVLFLPMIAAAVVVVLVGLRGKPQWSAPYCVKCKYDLRGGNPDEMDVCPECGSSLTDKKAVGFVRYGRRWGLITLGVAIGLWPVLFAVVSLGMTFIATPRMGPAPANMAQQTNAALISFAATNPDDAWVWDELEARLLANSLAQSEADQVIDDYINYMKANHPEGLDQPLHWSGDFFKAARRTGMMDDPATAAFLDAFYGPIPRLESPLERSRVGQHSVAFTLEYGSNWDPLDRNDVKFLSHISEVRIDGEAVELQNTHSSNTYQYGRIKLPNDLAPGEHDVAFELDLAYVDAADMVGLHDQEPPENWPTGLKRWTATETAKLIVYGPNDQPVTMIDDPNLAPMPGQTIRLVHCTTRNAPNGVKVSLEMEVQASPVPLSFDVILAIDGKEYAAKEMTYRQHPNRSSYSGVEQEVTLPALPPKVTTLDVILRPNPKHVYRDPLVTECWGEEVVLENVPIRRLDRQRQVGENGDDSDR